MDHIKRHEIMQLDHHTEEYALVLYLEDFNMEFARELDGNQPEKQDLRTIARDIIKKRYPNMKVTMVKVIIGGLAVTSIPLTMGASSVQAAEANMSTTTQSVTSSNIYYQVSPGDTLWGIARQYNTSVEQIKVANNLKSDQVRLNQQLIIPKAIHTVVKGDSLSALARQHNVSIASIREANNLSADTIRIGQQLIIPSLIQQTPPVTQESKTNEHNATYTVVAGDSLSVIAKRFSVSVDALKSANNLTSDTVRVGQVLSIPSTTTNDNSIKPSPTSTTSYTVVAGDNLSTIAKRYGITVDVLRTTNNLTSDLLRIGQVLTIPLSDQVQQSPVTVTKSYQVKAGDTLWGIARQFNTTTSAIRDVNNLTSDTLSIGQTLSIPGPTDNTLTPTQQQPTETTANKASHTVKSGETLWGIARTYGVTVDAIKTANSLTSDTLRLGQTLTIPATNNTVEQGKNMTEQQPAQRTTFSYSVRSGDNLTVIAKRFDVTVDSIRTANRLTSDVLRVGQVLTIPDGSNAPMHSGLNTITYTTHTVVSGDTIWDLSVRYGIPQAELMGANNLTSSSRLAIGQKLTIPVHHIGQKTVVSERHGEYMDWWTEAQYIFTIGTTAKVTDLDTGKSFYIKRTIGANHADSETLTRGDSDIARSIWGGYSWTPRAVVIDIDGRRIAASMSFMPHEREFITNNGITGHFDVYFGDSTRHKDGQGDPAHQRQVERAAGMTAS